MSALRQFVRAVLTEGELKHSGAGIVVLRDFDGEWRVLGLEADDGMDLPKGHAEDGETPEQTAIRETSEEASLSSGDLSFEWGKDPLVIDGHLFMYVASTTTDPKIQRNPESGKIEHKRAAWLSFDQMEDQAQSFLVPAVVWAKGKVVESGK